MTATCYVCPTCGEHVNRMRPRPGRHSVRPHEIAARPEVWLVADEDLRCPCGAVNTWFTLEQVPVRIDGRAAA
jgi:hypothetical protein